MRTVLTVLAAALCTTAITHAAHAETVGVCDFSNDSLTLRAPGAPPLRVESADGGPLGADAQPGLTYVVPGPVDIITANGRTVGLLRGLDVDIDCELGGLSAGYQVATLPLLDGASNGASADAIEAMEDQGFSPELGEVSFRMGWAPGAALDDVLGPHADDTWYVFLDARIEGVSLTFGTTVVDPGLSSQVSWWLDPTDPAVYVGVRGGLVDLATMGYVTGFGVGFSTRGNLQWTPSVPLRGPDGPFDPALFGHVAVESEVQIQPVPRTKLSIGIDADFMFDLGDGARTADMAGIARDFRARRRVELAEHRDVRVGANIRSVTLNHSIFSMHLGSGSFFADRDGVYLNADPEYPLGVGFIGVSTQPVSNDRVEKLRRLLTLMEIDPTEVYLYVDRADETWGIGMIADITAPGCIFHDAHVQISDAGIDVQGNGCDFAAWAQEQLSFVCEFADNDVNRCEEAAERDACDFDCDIDMQRCYEDCRDEGHGAPRCGIRCGVTAGGCEISQGLSAVCDAALAACAQIDDWCEGPDATEPPLANDPIVPPVIVNPPVQPPVDPEPVEPPAPTPPNTPNCTPQGVTGFSLQNLGTTGCGRWTKEGTALVARGNLHTPGMRPKTGSLLVSNFAAPRQLRDGRIDVRIQGDDDDVAGVVFGYQGAQRYYLAVLDEQNRQLQVWRRDLTGFHKLAQRTMAVNFSAGHRLQVHRGANIRVVVDGVQRLTVDDTRFRWGRYGVYSYANSHMRFINLQFVASCGSNEFTNFEMVNLGSDGCGAWDRDAAGRMVARGNLHTAGRRPKTGSMLVRKSLSRLNGDVRATIQGDDNDVAGLIIDFKNDQAYTFAVLDEEQGVVQLWKRLPVVGFLRVAERSYAVNFSAGHTVRLRRSGDAVAVFVDGARVLRADVPSAGGRMGIYAYGMAHMGFAGLSL